MIKGSQQDGIQRMLPFQAKAVSQMMAESFSKDNQLWQSLPVPFEDAKEFFEGIVDRHLKAQHELQVALGKRVDIALVHIQGGRLIGCMLNYTLQQHLTYLNSPKIPQKFELFTFMEKLSKVLMQGVDFSVYPAHSTIYSNFFARNMANKFSRQSLVKFIAEYFLILKRSGFRYVILRATNPKAPELLKNIGFKAINEVIFEKADKKFPIFLMECDLQNPVLASLQQTLLRPKL